MNTKRLLSFLAFSSLNYTVCVAQLSASYKVNEHTNTCINLSLSNESKDSIYIISHSYSIQYRDSCFGYTVRSYGSEQKIHVIDITNYHLDNDHAPHARFYLQPGTSHDFGARANVQMLQDSLFINFYATAIHKDDKATLELFEKRRNQKSKRPNFIKRFRYKMKYERRPAPPRWNSEWKSIFCGRVN